MKLPPAFDALPDSASVRIVTVEGYLSTDRAPAVLAVLREVLGQWRAAGAIRAGAADTLEGGAFVVVAFQLSKGSISGCTRDQLTHTLLGFEQMLGRRVLNAPRCVAQTSKGIVWLSPAEFRAAAAAGDFTANTVVYDLLVESLGDVRAGRFATSAGASWYARLLPVVEGPAG